MAEDLKHIEQIEQYCEGKMSQAEKSAFEAELLLNEGLNEELELYRKIVDSFKITKEDSIRANLRQIDVELDKNMPVKANGSFSKNKYRNYFAIAASIAIFIGLASYFVFFYTSTDKLIASFEVEEPGLPVLMGGSTNIIYDDAMSAYQQNDYPTSLTILQNLFKENPTSDTLNYFIGIIYAKTKKTNDAIPFFENVMLNVNSIFRLKASYQLGLCYWRTNDNYKAREIFQQISLDNNSPFSKNAAEIMKRL